MFFYGDVRIRYTDEPWTHDAMQMLHTAAEQYVEPLVQRLTADQTPAARWLDHQLLQRSPLNIGDRSELWAMSGSKIRLRYLNFCGYSPEPQVAFLSFASNASPLKKLLGRLGVVLPEGLTTREVSLELAGRSCMLVVPMSGTHETVARAVFPFEEEYDAYNATLLSAGLQAQLIVAAEL